MPGNTYSHEHNNSFVQQTIMSCFYKHKLTYLKFKLHNGVNLNTCIGFYEISYYFVKNKNNQTQ